ncbi:MAG: hypothetical protein AAF529_10505 [Pseudomonadota bacterium]
MNTPPLALPPIDQLSFTDTSVAGLEEWSAGLPLINTEATATQLEMALAELWALQEAPQQKFNLLDALRPLVYYARSRLEKQNIDEHITPVRLMRQLCQCYQQNWQAALDQLSGTSRKTDRHAEDALCKSAHRFFADMGRMYLHCMQAIDPLPDDFWIQLHHVYFYLEELQLTEFSLGDDENSKQAMSLSDVYKRILLFHAANPNQLASDNLIKVYQALELWAASSSIDTDASASLLAFNLNEACGPRINSHVKRSEATRFLSTHVLSYELEAFANEVSCSLPIPDNINTRLLRHLAQAWGEVSVRNFKRVAADHTVRLCVGLRAAHYYLSGGVEFNDQISNKELQLRREVNPFLELDYVIPGQTDDGGDPWSQAHDLKVRIPENPNVEVPEELLRQRGPQRKYAHFELKALDTSPGGYRVEWQDAPPQGIQAGDLVALREESDARWCVAALSWISNATDNVQMGLQLLAPRAIPVAIRAIKKRGSSAGLARALLLPELKAIGQPATLITPNVPFVAGQKVNLQRQGISGIGLLQEPLLSAQSFNQFTFRMLDGYLENQTTPGNISPLSAMTREDPTQDP